MKRWLILPVLVVGALALTAIGLADPGHGHKNKPNAKGGKFVFHVTTDDHGCSFRPWATDTLRRVYKVRRNHDGSYTVRREDKGRFVTLAGQSPSADPCPGVIRRGKHGQTLAAGKTGGLHGYLQGKVTGGTFNPIGHLHGRMLEQRLHLGLLRLDGAVHVQQRLRRLSLQLRVHGSAPPPAGSPLPPLGRPRHRASTRSSSATSQARNTAPRIATRRARLKAGPSRS